MNEDSQRSLVDSTTGLYSADGFRILATQYVKLARRMRKRLGLILALLDDPRTEAGAVPMQIEENRLTSAAEILKLTFRDSDILARVGPDEFAVLVPEIARKGEEAIRQRLEQRIESYNERPYGAHPLNLRLGIICPDPKSAYTLDDLLTQAERELTGKPSNRR